MPSLSSFGKSKTNSQDQPPPSAPPEWAPAPETSFGLKNEASEEEFEAAEEFCATYPVEPPRLLSTNVIERINTVGCKVWGLETPHLNRFIGSIRNPEDAKNGDTVARVETTHECGDTCILTNYPLVAGLYEIQGKQGVYYEVTIIEMIEEGFVAVGTACRPYPEYRLPGWNRLSAGLHLDDMRKFFEDPCGGRDYLSDNTIRPGPGDTIGCGFEFQTGAIFFTYNGMRLPNAFTGVYLPRTKQDVYAAVGVSGAVNISVNFGGDYFRWLEGNEWSWRVEGQVGGNLGAVIEGSEGGDLPSYGEASSSSRTYGW
ncbi:hypothetical protein C0995_011155 [Termitomyces sp. Mi166|nr:hypothetical protein C0995_011155 [Termitomyces sp. Mi166\